jgi:hypothetical protein
MIANILGGVPGSDAGKDASEDEGDKAGVDDDDERWEEFTDEGWACSWWSFCQGEPCNS